MNKNVTLYHNSRCSQSRTVLKLLAEHGIEPVIVPYGYGEPLDVATIRQLMRMLKVKSVRDIIRTSEDLYMAMRLEDSRLSEEMLIETLAAHPQLLERPIVVVGNKARIGRPPEKILEIL